MASKKWNSIKIKMNTTMEVHNINISGIIFHVEGEGHCLLKTYLKPLKNNIYRDFEFEGKIAEFLLLKLKNGYANTTVDDVLHLIKALGPIPQMPIDEEGSGQMKEELFPFIRLFNNKPIIARTNFQFT